MMKAHADHLMAEDGGHNMDESAFAADESQDQSSVFTKREGTTNRKLVDTPQFNRKKKGATTKLNKPHLPSLKKSGKQED